MPSLRIPSTSRSRRATAFARPDRKCSTACSTGSPGAASRRRSVTSRRSTRRSSSSDAWAQRCQRRGRHDPRERLLEPVEVQSLAEHEVRGRRLVQRPARSAHGGDDVRRIGQLGVPGRRLGHLGGHAAGDVGLAPERALGAPLAGAELPHARRQLHEGRFVALDQARQVVEVAFAQVPAGKRLDEPVDAPHELHLRPPSRRAGRRRAPRSRPSAPWRGSRRARRRRPARRRRARRRSRRRSARPRRCRDR